MRDSQFPEARPGQRDREAGANQHRVGLLARVVTAANVEHAGRDARHHSPQRPQELLYGYFGTGGGHGPSGFSQGDERGDPCHAGIVACTVPEPAFFPGAEEFVSAHDD